MPSRPTSLAGVSDASDKKSIDHSVVREEVVDTDNELQRGLKNRHVQMIS